MKKMPLVKSIMKPFPYTVRRNDRILAASTLMEEHDIRHLPVTDDSGLIGVISDRDIKFLIGSITIDHRVEDISVEDAMFGDPYVVDMNTPLDQVLLTMAERHIGSAIVTKKGKLAGLFTTTDVCRYFGEYLQQRFPTPDGNEAA